MVVVDVLAQGAGQDPEVQAIYQKLTWRGYGRTRGHHLYWCLHPHQNSAPVVAALVMVARQHLLRMGYQVSNHLAHLWTQCQYQPGMLMSQLHLAC
jgi:hypothetical protein